MADDDFDPIRIQWSEPLDRCFAKFDFWSDNSPRDPDGSIPIRGSVAFGVRRQKGKRDRAYAIGIKFAFLEIMEAECQFKQNMELQQQVQEGILKERATATDEGSLDFRGAAEVSAKAGARTANCATGLKTGGGYQKVKKTNSKREQQYELYRVRWVASGCEFGDRKQGNPYDDEGILRGIFLNGHWGDLVPKRGILRYGAEIKLLLPKGGLTVTPESKHISDRFPDAKQRQANDAFDALKSAVAGWVLETELSSCRRPKGYDNDRDELVLAHGKIAVELSTRKLLFERPENRVPLQQPAATALPPTDHLAEAPPRKRTRQPRVKCPPRLSSNEQ